MQIVCDEEARDDAVRQDIDLVSFLGLLSEQAKRSNWDLCEVASSWGLFLFAFFSPLEKAMVPVNVDVFLLTKGEVVSDAGQIVPRWERLAEQVLAWADSHRKPRHVLIAD